VINTEDGGKNTIDANRCKRQTQLPGGGGQFRVPKGWKVSGNIGKLQSREEPRRSYPERGSRPGMDFEGRQADANGISIARKEGDQGLTFLGTLEVVAMKELIKYMAQALVDNPDVVTVSEIVGEQTSVIELRVAKEDLGKVIGKQGRTAKAMRTILSAASTKIRKRTVLEIIE
jgi:predicted RNA-binding protein YlqC (UPF0109 family)